MIENKCIEIDYFYDEYKGSHFKYNKWNNGYVIEIELQRFASRWYGEIQVYFRSCWIQKCDYVC